MIMEGLNFKSSFAQVSFGSQMPFAQKYVTSFVSPGDALYDMKQKLNVTGNQLSDWNQNQVNPCTWNSVICDSNNNVIQV